MNMKLDYSKTINEQIDTFNYYKNRYANYELEILKLQKENQELKKQLEEQDYTFIPNSEIKPILDKYKQQQEDFIEWLEDKITNCKELEERLYKKYRIPKYFELGQVKGMIISLKDALKEYKEIIGVSDES